MVANLRGNFWKGKKMCYHGNDGNQRSVYILAPDDINLDGLEDVKERTAHVIATCYSNEL